MFIQGLTRIIIIEYLNFQLHVLIILNNMYVFIYYLTYLIR